MFFFLWKLSKHHTDLGLEGLFMIFQASDLFVEYLDEGLGCLDACFLELALDE